MTQSRPAHRRCHTRVADGCILFPARNRSIADDAFMNGGVLNVVPEIVVNFIGPWAAFELVDKSYGDTASALR